MEFSISINSKFIAGLIFVAAVVAISYEVSKVVSKEK